MESGWAILGGLDGYGNSSYRKAVPESLNLDTLLGMPDAARRIEDKQDVPVVLIETSRTVSWL